MQTQWQPWPTSLGDLELEWHFRITQEGQALGFPCLSVTECGLHQEGTRPWQHSTASIGVVSPLLNEIWEVYITVVLCKATPSASRLWNMPTHCLALSLPGGNDTSLVTSSTIPTSILYHTCCVPPPMSLQRGPWLNFPPTATLWVLSASCCNLLLWCDPWSPWAEGGKAHTTYVDKGHLYSGLLWQMSRLVQ